MKLEVKLHHAVIFSIVKSYLRLRSVFVKTHWSGICLVLFFIWLHVSDYLNFWNAEIR